MTVEAKEEKGKDGTRRHLEDGKEVMQMVEMTAPFVMREMSRGMT